MRSNIPSLGMGLLFLFHAVSSASPLTLTFESLSEGDIVTSQFANLGVIFAGTPVVVTSGSLLNELDFPPTSGNNVIADLGGPVEVQFLFPSPVFSAFFTYTTQLSLTAYTPSGAAIRTITSSATANLGSVEELGFLLDPAAGPSIGSVRISGLVDGASFTLDDVTFQPVPEPALFGPVAVWLALIVRRRASGAVDTRLED